MLSLNRHKEHLFSNPFLNFAIEKRELSFDSFPTCVMSKSHVSDINSMNIEKKINTIVSPTAHFIRIFPVFSLALFMAALIFP